MLAHNVLALLQRYVEQARQRQREPPPEVSTYRLLSQSKEEMMANKFKRGQMVRFETVGRGYRVKRKGTVARTIDTARGTRVEVTSDDGVFRPRESLVRAI